MYILYVHQKIYILAFERTILCQLLDKVVVLGHSLQVFFSEFLTIFALPLRAIHTWFVEHRLHVIHVVTAFATFVKPAVLLAYFVFVHSEL